MTVRKSGQRPHMTVGFWLGAAVASIVASGCVNSPPIYGENWPPQVKLEADACPSIDGYYENAGRRSAGALDSPRPASLVNLLEFHARSQGFNTEPGFNPDADAYQEVRLRVADDFLYVDATSADGNKRSFIIPTRRHCRDSLLYLESQPDAGTIVVASMYERSSIALGRADDGSLLVRGSERFAAFFLYVPVLGINEGDWTIFPPAARASERPAGFAQ